MSLSPEARKYMDMWDSLNLQETELIDALFNQLYIVAGEENIPAAKDDRAAELEAAIIKFIIESRER